MVILAEASPPSPSEGTPLWVTITGYVVIVATLLIQNRLTRRREVELRLAERKQALALRYMHWFITMMAATKTGKGQLSPKVVQEFAGWLHESFFVASDDVIREAQNLLHQLGEHQRQGKTDTPPMKPLGKLLVALRKDTGNVRTKVGPRDALRNIITESDWTQIDEWLR